MRLYTTHLLPALAAARAPLEQQGDGHFCSKVNSIVARWSEQSAVTSHCSSFVQISPQTATTTTTPTQLVMVAAPSTGSTATITKTTTVTVTRTAGVTKTSTSTATDTLTKTDTTTVTSVLTGCDRPGLGKREALHAPIHWPFSNSQEMSSACSCVSIYASTTTTTKTAPTATVTSTVAENALATVTVTRTATNTATTTKTTTIVTTKTKTTTSSATATNISPVRIGGTISGPPNAPYRLACPFSNSAHPALCTFATGVTGDNFSFIDQSKDFQLNVPNIGFNFLGISGAGGSHSADVTAEANNNNDYPHLNCNLGSGTSGECSLSCSATTDAGTKLPYAYLCNGSLLQYFSTFSEQENCTPVELFAFPASAN